MIFFYHSTEQNKEQFIYVLVGFGKTAKKY